MASPAAVVGARDVSLAFPSINCFALSRPEGDTSAKASKCSSKAARHDGTASLTVLFNGLRKDAGDKFWASISFPHDDNKGPSNSEERPSAAIRRIKSSFFGKSASSGVAKREENSLHAESSINN